MLICQKMIFLIIETLYSEVWMRGEINSLRRHTLFFFFFQNRFSFGTEINLIFNLSLFTKPGNYFLLLFYINKCTFQKYFTALESKLLLLFF